MNLWSDFMEILNLISNNLTVFVILIIILIINFCCILYLVLKERKEDKEEINEILNEMNPVEEQQDQKLAENKREVEEMLMKMQQDLETKPEDAVTNFENEQEEKSIISYQELLESVKNSKEQTNVIPVKIEDEKIEIEEDEEPIIRIEEQAEQPKEENSELDELKKFKSKNFFISPIFGKQENNIKYPTVPKNNTTKIEEFINENNNEDNLSITKRLDEEITKNESFLNALKEFRKNLD
jgi:hypothetical protein